MGWKREGEERYVYPKHEWVCLKEVHADRDELKCLGILCWATFVVATEAHHKLRNDKHEATARKGKGELECYHNIYSPPSKTIQSKRWSTQAENHWRWYGTGYHSEVAHLMAKEARLVLLATIQSVMRHSQHSKMYVVYVTETQVHVHHCLLSNFA